MFIPPRREYSAPKPLLNLFELQLFFLLPFGFEFFILLCSTVSFFQDLKIIPAACQSHFFDLMTSQNNIDQRWYKGKYLNIVSIVYKTIIGSSFLFYFKFFKTGVSREVWKREKQTHFPDYGLWFLTSLIIPILNNVNDEINAKTSTPGNGNGTTPKSNISFFIGVLILLIKFASIYFYVQKSFSTFSSHFRLLYRNKNNEVDSSRIGFFAKNIFGILLVDIVLSIASMHLMNWIFPKIGQTENQQRIEQEESKAFLIISVLFFAPLFEELIYRRSILKPANFHPIAVAASSFIFGLIHLNVTKETIFHIIPYSIGGLIFALTYRKFRNIWISIFIHFLHNLLALIVTFSK